MTRTPLVAFVALLGLASAGALRAQGAEAPKPLDRIEIVGSHLKRVEQEGPAPVTVIRRAEIDASGAERLGDFLLVHPLAGAGGFDDRSTGFGPALGASGLSLRGLGAPATLVLLNGRRLASYGVVLENDASFVDLNSVPLAAVERVEILRDGASAIYGADAIGGVVNIVLRSDFRGVEVALRGGGTTRGDASRRSVQLGAGAGDLGADGWNAFVLLDASRQDPLGYMERDFSRSGDQRPRGGNDQRSIAGWPPTVREVLGPGRFGPFQAGPGCPAERVGPQPFGPPGSTCRFEVADYTDLMPASERTGLLGVGSWAPRPELRLFGEVLASHGRTAMRQAPSVVNVSVGVDEVHPEWNPLQVPVRAITRLVPGGPRHAATTIDFASAALGADGTRGAWDWSLAAGASRVVTRDALGNQALTSRVQSAVDAGTIQPLTGFADPDAVAEAMGRVDDRYRGTIAFVALKGSAELARLAAGPLALALGAELRREAWATALDPITLSGDLGSANNLGTTDASARRRVRAAYAELNWPAARGLELQIAARHDAYSDHGASTSPRLALRWQPEAAWLFRGSVGRGFLPPSLMQTNRPRSALEGVYFDPRRCPDGICEEARFLQTQEGNPQVRPERSRQHNLGLVFEPRPGLSVGLDVWRIAHVDKIALGDVYLIDHEAQFPGRVIREAPSPEDIATGLPGPIVELRDTYINIARREVRGADLEGRVRLDPRPWGRLSLDGLVSWTLRHDEQVARDQPTVDRLGVDGRTRVRSRAGLGWSRGSWRTGAAMNHVGGYRYLGFLGQEAQAASWTTMDLHLGWTTVRGEFSLVVRNATDRDPPMLDRLSGYDPGVHDPLGRVWTLTWRRAL